VLFVTDGSCLSLTLSPQTLVLCFAQHSDFKVPTTRIAVGPMFTKAGTADEDSAF
jgi:hypothetical protein